MSKENNNEKKDIKLYGKIAKFPKNTKASKAFSFLENIKINKNKLWYFIIEKEIALKDNNTYEELQVIKYNNKQGVNCQKFIETLRDYYANKPEIYKYVESLQIDGDENFSIIRNIQNVDIGDKKLISILMEDIIKLLYK